MTSNCEFLLPISGGVKCLNVGCSFMEDGGCKRNMEMSKEDFEKLYGESPSRSHVRWGGYSGGWFLTRHITSEEW